MNTVSNVNLENIDPDLNIFETEQNLCDYYTVDNYNLLITNNSTSSDFNVRLMNYNIRSFHANGHKFELLLDTISVVPNFIVLTETWNTEHTLCLCKLNSFQGCHSFRSSRRGGGVSVFCEDNFCFNKIESISVMYDHIETCAVKVNIGQNKYLVILAVYRPPSESEQNFVDSLCTLLTDSTVTHADTVFLAGDMNINILNLDSIATCHYMSCLNSLFYFPTVNKATRFPNNLARETPSNLDHIWINKINPTSSYILNIDFTDHCPVLLHVALNINTQKIEERIKIQFRPFSKLNLNSLILKICSADWNVFYQQNDPHQLVENFIALLNKFYCQTFPRKTKYLTKKRMQKPWLTQNLTRLIRQKSEYFHQYRLGLISKENNNRFKLKVNKIIRKSKKQYYVNAFDNFRNDAKKSWRTIKSLMGNETSYTEVKKLVMNGTSYTEVEDIAEKFNEFFTNIATQLDAQLPQSDASPYASMPPPHPSSFYLFPVTEQECFKIILSIKNSKTNIDEMPVSIFKSISDYIIKPLVNIMNKCFNSGAFPNCLKIGRVTQIFKSGKRSDPANYRPIITLPYLSKMF